MDLSTCVMSWVESVWFVKLWVEENEWFWMIADRIWLIICVWELDA